MKNRITGKEMIANIYNTSCDPCDDMHTEWKAGNIESALLVETLLELLQMGGMRSFHAQARKIIKEVKRAEKR